MHVIVIGAGVIGVCSAWYLREAGFDVTVLDRRPGAAQETSFGNAGVIAPGYVTPWAAPGMPGKVLRTLFASASPVVFRPSADPAMWRWIARWLGECRLERYRINKMRMQRLAFYSRACLHALRAQLDIEYEQSQGYLQLFRTARDLDMAAPALALLKENGVPHRLLDAEACRRLEPGLAPDTTLAGGLHLPEDETGNCPVFTHRLRELAQARGVRFRMETTATRIARAADGRLSIGMRSTDGSAVLQAERVVVAAGVDSAPLLRPLGLRVPLYPVKGYSATVAVRDELQAPVGALMDESYKVAITRMGKRFRIAGTAELGSRRLDLRPAAIHTLLKVGRDWFPGAGDYNEASLWVGARPMLPDGPPLIGPTSVHGLYLNLGHGSTGWAMACGSGRLLADQLACAEGRGGGPDIDMEGLTPARYGLGPQR